ncbi:MIZ zinc finger protein [Rhizoctonia solani AG-3 Rhs1AP]|uniref:MIZ zinc finger protein n=1 Tax=Rhizoctonia solani AG-3 Rhs1AP TaxID=1086054 RepID=X8JEK3_9AGAM|nr:MIZ zinc finger protein [Rhizoctonia solani AG-3 Rhs1AP]
MSNRKLIKEIRALRRLTLTEVKQSIIRTMANNPDIEAQRLTISLRCPISHTRIKDPCRFSGCEHYQCFDASAFLDMIEEQPSGAILRCPVCEQEAPKKTLSIDLYFESVLRRAPATTEEVYLQADGGWRTGDGQTMPPPMSPSTPPTQMSLGDAVRVAAGGDYQGTIVVQMSLSTFFCIFFFFVICFTGLFLALLATWSRLPIRMYTL